MHPVATSDVRRPAKPFFIAWSIALAFYALASQTAARSFCLYFGFRSFYAAGVQIRANPAGLYDLGQQQRIQDAITPWFVLPFYHPAYETLIVAPFTLLPYRGAYLAFIVFNLTLVMASFLVLQDTFSATLPFWQPRPGLMFFPFLPLIVAVFEGQDSILSLFVCCVAWRCLERERVVLTGLVLSLWLFKFNLALPVVLVLAVWKGWRLAAGFAAGSAAVVLSCIALVGRSATASYLALLWNGGLLYAHTFQAQRAYAVFPVRMPNLYGLVYILGHTHLSPHLLVGITSALSILVLFRACVAARRLEDGRAIYSVAILCALLVSHHLFLYDLTLLLLPIALLHDYPRHTVWTGICYTLPPLLLLFFGSEAFFLVSLPVLAAFVRLTYPRHCDPPSGREITQHAIPRPAIAPSRARTEKRTGSNSRYALPLHR